MFDRVHTFAIKKISKREEESGPFIITLNDAYHLIGNKARALERYIKKGMIAKVQGYYHGDDFLVEALNFPDGVVKGVQIDLRV